MDNRKLAEEIIKNVGEKDNIISAEHCATRLRFHLKDFSKRNDEAIMDLDDVKGTNLSNNQYQIILGSGKVNLVTDEVLKIIGDEKISDAPVEKEGNWLQRAVKTLSDIFVPIIPAIVAGGLLMGLNNILTAPFFNGRSDSIISLYPGIAGLAQMINTFSSAAFAFLPVLIGFSATKKFGGNPYLGAAMGMIMVHPDLLNAYSLAATPAGDIPLWNIFGWDIPAVGYQGTVLPVLAVAWILAKIETRLHKVTPTWLDNLTTPLLATLITGFITFAFVGPLLRTAGDLLTVGITSMYNTLGFLGGALFGLFYAPITMTGMHHSFIPIETQLIAKATTSAGGSFIFPTASMNNVAQGAAVLAVLMTTKNEKMKSTAAASGVSALLGITEPAMFGINLRLRYPFIAAIIGSAVGSAWLAFRHVLAIALGAAGIPGFISIRPESWLDFGIGMILAFGVSFGLTIFFDKSGMLRQVDKDDESKVKNGPTNKELIATNDEIGELELFSPMKGLVKPISESEDGAFASKALGDGVAIDISSNQIFAPCDAKVETVFPTGHAIGLSTSNGINILIHAGIDTVNLEGKGFKSFVSEGDAVKKGDLLMEMDPQVIKEAGYSTQTMLVLMDVDESKTINVDQGQKEVGDHIIRIS
ncbi:sucrose-specific PTS transporter subunit IIBC [Anaerococcus urinomassiliensis]|uniref:sucrose-specific PTS transporter subunit IIBC n=1 Tax=Anaerococcus urinomassiliensis TaxID=1745712 RepID=UPI00093F106F|nr:sucrose-specific PTS transporter subunit IIBC [Anaerococcus urinomassiliensis]